MTDIFLIFLMESSWDPDTKFQDRFWIKVFIDLLTAFLPSKSVKFHFRLGQKPRQERPGTSLVVTSKQERFSLFCSVVPFVYILIILNKYWSYASVKFRIFTYSVVAVCVVLKSILVLTSRPDQSQFSSQFGF